MEELIANQIVTTIVGFAIGGIGGFLAGSLRRLSKVEKAKLAISRISAARHIRDDYQRYVLEDRKMTINAYEDSVVEYEAYKVLSNGNTGLDNYMNELLAKKPYLVTD